MRISTDRLKVKLKTKTASENLVTGSRNIVAMTRGVSWALANCTTSKSDEQTKTKKGNIAPANIPNTARIVSGSSLESNSSDISHQYSNRKEMMPRKMARTGTIQMEFRT